MLTVEGLKAWEGKLGRLRVGQGDDVQVFTHQVHCSRGVHGSPCDVLEKVEAYLGGLSSSLKDALILFLLAD